MSYESSELRNMLASAGVPKESIDSAYMTCIDNEDRFSVLPVNDLVLHIRIPSDTKLPLLIRERSHRGETPLEQALYKVSMSWAFARYHSKWQEISDLQSDEDWWAICDLGYKDWRDKSIKKHDQWDERLTFWSSEPDDSVLVHLVTLGVHGRETTTAVAVSRTGPGTEDERIRQILSEVERGAEGKSDAVTAFEGPSI